MAGGRVSILGKGPGRGLAPRVKGEHIWVINNSWVGQPAVSLIVDMHNLDWSVEEIVNHYRHHLADRYSDEILIEKAKQSHNAYQRTKEYSRVHNIPIMSQKVYDDCPGFEFPLEQVIKKFDCDQFTSGVNYAIAYAIYRKYKQIDIYGVNCVLGEEWENLREGVLLWIGIAKGQRIKVTVTGLENRPLRAYDGRLYGYNIPQAPKGILEEDGVRNLETGEELEFQVWREI